MSASTKRSRPKGKRGRPSLKIQKNSNPHDQSHSLRSVLENYETSKLNYECSLFTQQLCLMLQRIAVSPALSAFAKDPVYQLLVKTDKEVMLTELEVALWNVVLRRTEAESRELDLLLYFRISAFAVRRATEGEVMLSDVEAYLDTKPGFQRFFGKWFEQHRHALETPLLELNQVYESLTQPLGPADCHPYLYSLIIDDIIDEPFASNDMIEEEENNEQQRDRSQGAADIVSGMHRRNGEAPGQLPELPGVPTLEPLEGFEPFRNFSEGSSGEE